MRKFPKRIHYKYRFQSHIKKTSLSFKEVGQPRYGIWGIKSLEAGRLHWWQIDKIKFLLIPLCRKRIRIWTHVNFDTPLTSKATHRMGAGKGKLKDWVCRIRRGEIFFEFGRVPIKFQPKLFRLIRHKMPLKFCFVKRLM